MLEPLPTLRHLRPAHRTPGRDVSLNVNGPCYYPLPLPPPRPRHVSGGNVNDSVTVDAKRILLRYGAPISVLDNVSDVHRVEFAREISRTTLTDREPRMRELLKEHGYLEED